MVLLFRLCVGDGDHVGLTGCPCARSLGKDLPLNILTGSKDMPMAAIGVFAF